MFHDHVRHDELELRSPSRLSRHPTTAHQAFKSVQNLKSIVNESFAVINKCIEQFDSFRALIRDELLQRTRFAGAQVSEQPMDEESCAFSSPVATISNVNTNTQRSSSR